MAERKRMTAEQVVSYLMEEEALDFLRESLSWVVQKLMEVEVSELVGASRGERSPEERLKHRNGYRARTQTTPAGEIELAIPKIRRGSYSRRSLSRVGVPSRRWSAWCARCGRLLRTHLVRPYGVRGGCRRRRACASWDG